MVVTHVELSIQDEKSLYEWIACLQRIKDQLEKAKEKGEVPTSCMGCIEYRNSRGETVVKHISIDVPKPPEPKARDTEIVYYLEDEKHLTAGLLIGGRPPVLPAVWPETEMEALEESIRKWRFIVKSLADHPSLAGVLNDGGSATCALCNYAKRKFPKKRIYNSQCCGECCLVRFSPMYWCEGPESPYREWAKSKNFVAAINMLAVLETVLYHMQQEKRKETENGDRANA